MPANFPYPDEETAIKAFQNRVKQEYNNVGRIFPDPNDSDAFRWFTRYGYDCGFMLEQQSANKHIGELHEALNAVPVPIPPNPDPGTPTARPLVGNLRVQDKLFRDDTGLRRVLFCSWFPALRILRDNPTEFYRQMDSIAASGYQGVRVFLAVGGWMGYWDGREVVPITFQKWYYTGNHLRSDNENGTVATAWPDYDDLLKKLCRAAKERNLRLHVTCGDMQIICPDPDREIELHQRFARILQSEGGSNLVSLYEITNEFPINRHNGDSQPSIDQMGRVIAAVSPILPGVLTCQGAGLSEEPENLVKASTYGPVCVSHTTRDPFDKCMKRTFGLVYWEGNYRGFPKPFWQGEPAGPGDDSYARQDDPANLTALYSMHALTGQASNWFQGAAVRSFQPLESEWGFKEMPSLLSLIPEDIAAWGHTHAQGGIEYWINGDKFITSTFKDWDTLPPRPIKEWTLYRGVDTVTGTGTPPKSTGLLIGTFR